MQRRKHKTAEGDWEEYAHTDQRDVQAFVTLVQRRILAPQVQGRIRKNQEKARGALESVVAGVHADHDGFSTIKEILSCIETNIGRKWAVWIEKDWKKYGAEYYNGKAK
jgi:hypothetical protein